VPDIPRSIALLVNPDSGSGTDPHRIAALLHGHGPEVTVLGPDDVAQAAGLGADRIAVASGDGGVGPAAAAAARAGVPLAVIPVGTANDFARGQGLPMSLDAAVQLAALGTSTRPLDLGWMGERAFLNAASAGLASLAGYAASGLKRALGPVAYFAGALWSGLTGRPIACAVLADGAPAFDGQAWQVTVAGTGSFGAGSQLEVASAHDGILDVAILEAGSRLRLVRYAYGLRAGRLRAQAGVRHLPAAAVELELDEPTTLNVDGELIPAGPVIDFRVERGAVRLVVPCRTGEGVRSCIPAPSR
jgi:diacylglycerol kinase (ATP)